MPQPNYEKQGWVEKYSARILSNWKQTQAPLGVDNNYRHQVKNDLQNCFDDPLKRALIENTY